MNPRSIQRSADVFIRENSGKAPVMTFTKEKILDAWYIRRDAKWITRLYSLYQHHPILRLDPRFNIGHEIHGLYKKTDYREDVKTQSIKA